MAMIMFFYMLIFSKNTSTSFNINMKILSLHFKWSLIFKPIETLHVEAKEYPLDMRKNEIRSNLTYTELLVTLDDSEDNN